MKRVEQSDFKMTATTLGREAALATLRQRRESQPKKLCSECKALQDLGWLEE